MIPGWPLVPGLALLLVGVAIAAVSGLIDDAFADDEDRR